MALTNLLGLNKGIIAVAHDSKRGAGDSSVLEYLGKRISELRELGLRRPGERRKSAMAESDHSPPRYPNLVKRTEVSYPDRIWVSDITYIKLQKEFVYRAVIMDLFTRSIRGWSLSRTEIGLTEYEGFAEALKGIKRFIEEVYQWKRIHSALGYLTPEEFAGRWWEGRVQAEVATLLKSVEKVSNFMGSLQSRIEELELTVS